LALGLLPDGVLLSLAKTGAVGICFGTDCPVVSQGSFKYGNPNPYRVMATIQSIEPVTDLHELRTVLVRALKVAAQEGSFPLLDVATAAR
jgi:hypothetical protein